MTPQLVLIPIIIMRIQGIGAEFALITLLTVVRAHSLEVSDVLFTCREPGRTVITGVLNPIMPKRARLNTKPCSLASLKKGRRLLLNKGAGGGQNKRHSVHEL